MNPIEGETVLYLLRHGATENNLACPPRLQGRGIDGGLSAEGREQARRSARLLAGIPLVAVYSSPLRRARETAELVGAPHRSAVQTVAALIEADVGSWEGRDWEEIARSEPEAYARFVGDPGIHGYAGGETFTQVQQRVVPAMLELSAAHTSGNVAVVGHNVVNRCFLAHVLGLPVVQARELVQQNCGVNVLRWRASHWKLVTLNSSFHLTGEP